MKARLSCCATSLRSSSTLRLRGILTFQPIIAPPRKEVTYTTTLPTFRKGAGDQAMIACRSTWAYHRKMGQVRLSGRGSRPRSVHCRDAHPQWPSRSSAATRWHNALEFTVFPVGVLLNFLSLPIYVETCPEFNPRQRRLSHRFRRASLHLTTTRSAPWWPWDTAARRSRCGCQ